MCFIDQSCFTLKYVTRYRKNKKIHKLYFKKMYILVHMIIEPNKTQKTYCLYILKPLYGTIYFFLSSFVMTSSFISEIFSNLYIIFPGWSKSQLCHCYLLLFLFFHLGSSLLFSFIYFFYYCIRIPCFYQINE